MWLVGVCAACLVPMVAAGVAGFARLRAGCAACGSLTRSVCDPSLDLAVLEANLTSSVGSASMTGSVCSARAWSARVFAAASQGASLSS